MYKKLKYTAIIPILLLVFLLSTNVTHAQFLNAINLLPYVSKAASGAVSSLASITSITFAPITYVLATVVYSSLQVATFFMTLAGAVLNISLSLTTNLGTFIEKTPVIYDLWAVFRDLSVLFLIFLLLWQAMLTILDLNNPNYKQTLVNIVIVGLLINFSFFFTSVLIDASNIVSRQIYNAMAPQTPNSCAASVGDSNNGYVQCLVNSVINNSNGGLSSVIANSMDVQKWWGISIYKNEAKLGDVGIAMRMAMVNTAGIFVMMIIGVSFLAASAAAIWRIRVLLLLLSSSPLWIAGYAFPKVKSEVSNKWFNHLKSNLLFLPIYLLLMYVAVRIIIALNVGKYGAGGVGTELANTVLSGNSTSWYGPFLELFFSFVIIIFFVNMPLFTAISLSGSAGTWTESIVKKVKGSINGWIGTRTLGRMSSGLDKTLANTRAGNSAIGRNLRSITTGKLATMKYGGGSSYADLEKEKKDIKKKSEAISRTKLIKRFAGSKLSADPKAFQSAFGQDVNKAFQDNMKHMSSEEKIASLGKEVLKDPRVAMFLSKSDMEAIKKSEISGDDQEEIKTARETGFAMAVTEAKENDGSTLKDVKKNMEVSDLVKYANKVSGEVPSEFIATLTSGDLDAMRKENLDADKKRSIGKQIMEWEKTKKKTHPAFSFVKKFSEEWTGTAGQPQIDTSQSSDVSNRRSKKTYS